MDDSKLKFEINLELVLEEFKKAVVANQDCPVVQWGFNVITHIILGEKVRGLSKAKNEVVEKEGMEELLKIFGEKNPLNLIFLEISLRERICQVAKVFIESNEEVVKNIESIIADSNESSNGKLVH